MFSPTPMQTFLAIACSFVAEQGADSQHVAPFACSLWVNVPEMGLMDSSGKIGLGLTLLSLFHHCFIASFLAAAKRTCCVCLLTCTRIGVATRYKLRTLIGCARIRFRTSPNSDRTQRSSSAFCP